MLWRPVLTALGASTLVSTHAHAAAGGQETAVGAGAEEITLRLLYQLIAILVATRIVTWVVRHLGQTDVSGEILAGLLLGPSLLGAVFPGFMHSLFDPSTGTIFTGLAQVGLVFLMFQIGLEFEFGRHLGGDRRPIVVISLLGIAVPFVMGYLSAPWFHARLSEPVPLFGFQLFFAVAMSITAIPILGRIFMELGLSHTRTAALTIAAAAIDDVSGWMILGAISLLVKGAFSWGWVVPRVIGLAAYLALVFLVLRKPLKRAIASHVVRHGGLSLTAVPYIVTLLFISAAITSNLGVFAIIGGFVIGVALHDDRRFVEEWKRRVSPIVWAFFLPIFFAYTGLRTDVGTIRGWPGASMLLLVLAVAFVSKFGGAYVAAPAGRRGSPERPHDRRVHEHARPDGADRPEHRQGPGAAADRHLLHAGDHGSREHVHGHPADSLADEGADEPGHAAGGAVRDTRDDVGAGRVSPGSPVR